ncbi:hypothetical protein HF673_01295 [Acidithiobacillus thiooxidans]|uniref:Uncharacterized protein n=2 Tax=Acidithiobacillus thiooxidans TaxID=930 RepID=A0A1C2ITX0_ACITH|nr:hypothetical protein [Acidithiobacillus thiooxidans]MBU2834451.1 hypothetical protein [Acidithiobacillus thiooxidans]OCX73912.1 hypothetical protein A6M23_07390 [Acidithiobacillus thiooxidans]OCX79448.1 hypothetical protein A6P08_17855 [Acidithiobacillus thiooxidans]QFX96708.1 hypothetical protein GCD22_02522 [Acidithiobacillus thiooxidans ATCC 19377]
MGDILWFFNATILFSMLGVGALSYLLGWFFFRENEKIGNTLGIIGGMIFVVLVVIWDLEASYNVPESWLRNLPVAEKVMMRHYIETKHRPINIFTFRYIKTAPAKIRQVADETSRKIPVTIRKKRFC